MVLRIVLLLLLLPSCGNQSGQQWHMINVNHQTQGDAHLLIDNHVHVLIDTGELPQTEQYLIPYLREQKINRIHHLFISHPHTDHYSGITALLDEGIKIDAIYFNLPPEPVSDWNYKPEQFQTVLKRAEQYGASLQDVGEGFTVSLPSSQIETLVEYKQLKLNKKRVSVNDYSLILRWNASSFRVLFTGDLDKPLGDVLSEKTELIGADIVKVPHHGAVPVAPNAFMTAANPSFVMFPSTAALWNNPRGGPLRMWAAHHLRYYCHNGLNGNVLLSLKKATLSILSASPNKQCPNGLLDIAPKNFK